MVLTMPRPKRESEPEPVPSYRHRRVVIDGRVWEVIERGTPGGGKPGPGVSMPPLPPCSESRAAA